MPGYKPADKVLFNIMVSGIESSYENCLKNIEEILSGGNVHDSEIFIRFFIKLCLKNIKLCIVELCLGGDKGGILSLSLIDKSQLIIEYIRFNCI